MPELWLFFLGFLFVAVTRFLPDGVAGLLLRVRLRRTPAPGAPEPKDTAQRVVA
jgi:urea transport system permease protein